MLSIKRERCIIMWKGHLILILLINVLKMNKRKNFLASNTSIYAKQCLCIQLRKHNLTTWKTLKRYERECNKRCNTVIYRIAKYQLST